MAVSAAKILVCLVDHKRKRDASEDDDEDDDDDEGEEEEEVDEEEDNAKEVDTEGPLIRMDSNFNPRKGAHKAYWNTGVILIITHTATHTHTHRAPPHWEECLGATWSSKATKKCNSVSSFSYVYNVVMLVGGGLCRSHTDASQAPAVQADAVSQHSVVGTRPPVGVHTQNSSPARKPRK
jgi:hypothetical protein